MIRTSTHIEWKRRREDADHNPELVSKFSEIISTKVEISGRDTWLGQLCQAVYWSPTRTGSKGTQGTV
jgi:hypothetical protein